MDIPTHIFLPLTLVYVLRSDFKAKHFPLALFAILPDFDILTGIHNLPRASIYVFQTQH
jgi:hypothetical protein